MGILQGWLPIFLGNLEKDLLCSEHPLLSLAIDLPMISGQSRVRADGLVWAACKEMDFIPLLEEVFHPLYLDRAVSLHAAHLLPST